MFNIERLSGISLEFSEVMSGYVSRNVSLDYDAAHEDGRLNSALDPVMVRLKVIIPDLKVFFEDPEHEGLVEGHISFQNYTDGFAISNGKFKLFNKDMEGTRHLEYTFNWTNVYDVEHTFRGIKNIRDDPGFDALTDITTLFVDITSDPTARGLNNRGKLFFDAKDFPQLFGSIEVGSPNKLTQIIAKTAFFAFCAGEMTFEYALRKLGVEK